MRDSATSSLPPSVGQRLEGVITGVKPYGYFVQIGEAAGLCHPSAVPAEVNRAALIKGRSVSVKVRSITSDGKVSLALLALLPQHPPARSRKTTKAAHLANNAALGADNLHYGNGITKAIEEGSVLINSVGTRFRNNTTESRAGYVAEAVTTADFNIDAAVKRSPVRAERVDSLAKYSPDIQVKDASGSVVQQVSSKVYKSAEDTASSQRPYGTQVRLVPEDQLHDVRKIAKRGVASNRAKSGPNRAQIADEYQQVADHAADQIEQNGVKSRPRMRKDSLKLGDKAGTGSVSGADIAGSVRGRALDGAKAGAKSSAAISAGIAAAGGAYTVFQTRGKGKQEITKAAKQAGKDVAFSAADGAVKGAASSAATTAAKVLAQRAASVGVKRLLNSSAPATAALTAVELAKHSIDYARGKKTGTEFKEAAGSTVINNSATFIGAEIGFLIGGPIGALVGGFAAPLLLSAGRALFAGADPAQVKTELIALLDQTGAHDEAIAYHLAQLAKMLDALSASEAVLFPDRVLPTSATHFVSAEAVLVHRGRIYVADFKAWKGNLCHPEIMQTTTVVKKGFIWDTKTEVTSGTGRYDDSCVLQTKLSSAGYLFEKSHRNPAKPLRQFVWRLRQQLLNSNPQWKSVRITAVTVFPDGDVNLSAQMRASGHFMYFSEFLALLSSTEGKPTRRWMLDGLSTIPTWDLVQDASGSLRGGILETRSFTLFLEDGEVEIPFDAVLKLEAAPDREVRKGATTVTLHDRSVLDGVIGDDEIVLIRKGHEHRFALGRLTMVCPAYQLLRTERPNAVV